MIDDALLGKKPADATPALEFSVCKVDLSKLLRSRDGDAEEGVAFHDDGNDVVMVG